jgi:hypothetical protein
MSMGKKILTDPRSTIDHDVGQNYSPVSDHHIFIDHHVRPNVRPSANLGRRMNDRRRMNPRRILRWLVKDFECPSERQVGILRSQNGR